MGKLVTLECLYNGVIPYKEEGIKLLTEKEAILTYKAKASIGVNLESAKVNKGSKSITIEIPHSELFNKKNMIETDSIKIYTVSEGLFNNMSAEDVPNLMKKAINDFEKSVDLSNMKKQADKQAITMITQLSKPVAGDKNIKVVFRSN